MNTDDVKKRVIGRMYLFRYGIYSCRCCVCSRNCEKSKGGRINSLINVSYYCFRDSKLALCSNDNKKKMYNYIYI